MIAQSPALEASARQAREAYPVPTSSIQKRGIADRPAPPLEDVCILFPPLLPSTAENLLYAYHLLTGSEGVFLGESPLEVVKV